MNADSDANERGNHLACHASPARHADAGQADRQGEAGGPSATPLEKEE